MAKQLDSGVLQEAALDIAITAARLANYCDHVEHGEPADPAWVRASGAELRELAARLGSGEFMERYARRLEQIEAANPLRGPKSPNGATLAREAVSWRALQLVQVAHDRAYHPDVLGLSRYEQLRHYAFHLSKLAGAFARAARGAAEPEEIMGRRWPDVLLFGLKLATVAGESLGDEPLPAAASRQRDDSAHEGR